MDSPHGQQHSTRTSASDETRLRLLRAAAELMAQDGWGRVTTRGVATRAGLPHGTVSYHFRGKQELLTEAALHVFEQAFPIEQLDALEGLPDLLALFEPWFGERDAEAELIARVGVEAMLESERNEILRERMAMMLGQFRHAVAELVRAGQERGLVRPDVSPDAVATLLGALADGLSIHARIDPRLDGSAALGALLAMLTP